MVNTPGKPYAVGNSIPIDVTYITLEMPIEFSVNGSPLSGVGTFSVSKVPQLPNVFYAGPATGSAASATFRALVIADLPAGTGTVTDVLGTANRITSSGGATPVINISASYTGQTSITQIGLITVGNWNAKFTPRVVPMADTSSFTPTADTADINTQTNTQIAGTLTANAPSGTPVDGQSLELRISSTNVQTFAWNAIYSGCVTTSLPVATTGAGSTDKFWFQYNSTSVKWELLNAEYGYA